MMLFEKICKERSITFSKLSRMSDVPVQSIYNIRKRIQPPYAKRGQKIADAIEWTGDYQELFEDVQ